jgi:hypothetical protein
MDDIDAELYSGETFIIGGVEYFIDCLNHRSDLRPSPDEDELNLLDAGLRAVYSDPEQAKNLTTQYLLSKCSINDNCKSKKQRPRHQPFFTSNRKHRKHEYAEFQRLYKKSRKCAFERIFNKTSISPDLDCSTVFNFWLFTFTKTNFDSVPFVPPAFLPVFDATKFITPEEVISHRLKYSTAAGPDGVSPALLNRIPVRVRAKLFTAWLILGWAPSFAIDSRTIFIPKRTNVNDPVSLRPISISSVLIRQFHRILADRLYNIIIISPFQFGFRRFDGVSKGIVLLDEVLRSVKVDLCRIAAAVLDLEKAFDSVSHAAIFHALTRVGMPPHIISYLHYVYSSARTFLPKQQNIVGR